MPSTFLWNVNLFPQRILFLELELQALELGMTALEARVPGDLPQVIAYLKRKSFSSATLYEPQAKLLLAFPFWSGSAQQRIVTVGRPGQQQPYPHGSLESGRPDMTTDRAKFHWLSSRVDMSPECGWNRTWLCITVGTSLVQRFVKQRFPHSLQHLPLSLGSETPELDHVHNFKPSQ